MKIVLTADDFGFNDETVDATIDCLERGLLTGASIMANMPATARALDYARAHPERSWGVHLVWLSDGPEHPLSPLAEIPELIENGTFLASNRARMKGLLRLIDPDQIARETEAQLARVRDAGVALSYVDSHGHLHKFGAFRAGLARVLPRFGIERVRTVQDVWLRPPRRSPTYWLGAYWRRRLAARFRSTDHFYMPASAGDRGWSAPLLERLRLDAGTLEVGVHPGHGAEWQEAETRELPVFVENARARGHQLVGWREV